MLETYKPFIIVGLILIIIGIAIIALPLIFKLIPTLEKLEKLPKILVYVYRYNKFYFITSPILIIAGLAYFIYILWKFLK
jgi:hypothetical protein